MQKAMPYITLVVMLLILAGAVLTVWNLGSIRKDIDTVKKYAEFVAA